METWQAIVLAIIEGLTEFLPVSSTGHMVIGSALMGIEPTSFVKLFLIAIQLGTILSVLVLYYKRFLKSLTFYYKLVVAAIPASILGVLLNDKIDSVLESPDIVAMSLVVGGIVLLFVDRWFRRVRIEDVDDMNYKNAFMVGVYQCIALFPGVSRSASTIVGGMAQGMSRKAAAEFSFFLALPMMLGATVVKLYKYFDEGHSFTSHEMNLMIVGNVVGFLVAIVAIKFFISILTRFGFRFFGVYRIVVGLLILILMWSGMDLQIV